MFRYIKNCLIYPLGVLLILGACVGTDYITEDLPPAQKYSLRIAGASTSTTNKLIVGEGVKLSITFFVRGKREDNPSDMRIHVSHEDVLVVRNLLVMAVGVGEAHLFAYVEREGEMIKSDMFAFEILADPKAPTQLVISAHNTATDDTPIASVLVQGSLFLRASFLNHQDEMIEVAGNEGIHWTSTHPEVIGVDAAGRGTAHSVGSTMLSASYDELTSNTLLLNVVASATEVANILITGPSDNRLRNGASLSLSAKAFTVSMEVLSDVPFVWMSRNASVASVDASGVVMAHAPGETEIIAQVDSITSMPFAVVVIDPMAVTHITVSGDHTPLVVGGSTSLTASAFNVFDEVIQTALSWQSSNESVATVRASGVVTAVRVGMTEITAHADNISSMPHEIVIMNNQVRTGTLESANAYNVVGSVMLAAVGDHRYLLTFGSDFIVDRGPGVELFLSDGNSRATFSVVTAFQVPQSEKKYRGMYEISFTSPLDIMAYEYVVFYCVPFRVIFGYARLE